MTEAPATRAPRWWRLIRVLSVAAMTVPGAVLSAGGGVLGLTALEGYSGKEREIIAIAVGSVLIVIALGLGSLTSRSLRRHFSIPPLLSAGVMVVVVAVWVVALYIALRSREYGAFAAPMPTPIKWSFWSGLTFPVMAAGALGLVTTALARLGMSSRRRVAAS